MNETTQTGRICSQCHARIADFVSGQACPACGSALISLIGGNLDSQAAPPTIDHRGILLPSRHAVGGVITPR